MNKTMGQQWPPGGFFIFQVLQAIERLEVENG